MAYVRKTIGLEEEVYNGASKILKEELGMSVSKFIELTLRQLVRSKTHTQEQMMTMMAQELFDTGAKPKKVKGRPKKEK